MIIPKTIEEEKMDKKLENIIVIVEKSLEYDHCCSNPDCETYAYIDYEYRDTVKELIRKEIER